MWNRRQFKQTTIYSAVKALTIKYVISIHNNNKSLLGGNSSFLNGKRWRSLHLIQGIPKRPGLKYSGKMSIPREQPNQNKEMKIADSVLLSLFSRHTKHIISHNTRDSIHYRPFLINTIAYTIKKIYSVSLT